MGEIYEAEGTHQDKVEGNNQTSGEPRSGRIGETQKGRIEAKDNWDQRRNVEEPKTLTKGKNIISSPSESTIYKPVVKKSKVFIETSNSSEIEDMETDTSDNKDTDTSDDNIQKDTDTSDDNIDNMISNFVGKQRLALDKIERRHRLEQMENQNRNGQHQHPDDFRDHRRMLRGV